LECEARVGSDEADRDAEVLCLSTDGACVLLDLADMVDADKDVSDFV
jgi:hypothetical protein